MPKLGPSANLADRSVLPFSASVASGGAKYLDAETFQAMRSNPASRNQHVVTNRIIIKDINLKG